MSTVWLVTSAINGKNGISGKLTSEQRLQQTLETAKSIRTRVNQAHIVLLEGGNAPLDFKTRSVLKTLYDDILDYTQSSFIQFAHNNVNLAKQGITVIKGPCESWMLWQTCLLLNLTKYDRVFKISGRYEINDRFDLAKHTNAQGQYLMLQKLPGLPYYDNPNKLAYSTAQYSTRLYSFCGSILNKATMNYQEINQRLLDLYQRDSYIDIEHMTYLVLNPADITETQPIGVCGVFAENPDWKLDE
jgi:hypothetical protein